jgi:hypothetical protein
VIEVVKIPTDLECENCEFKKTIWQSQRGVLVVIFAMLFAYMWTVYVIAIVKYGVILDMTAINVVTAALSIIVGWYFYSKEKTEQAVVAAKLK